MTVIGFTENKNPNFCDEFRFHFLRGTIIPRQNKMSDKYERIKGGNVMVISTVLKPVFVFDFGHFILFR